MSRIPAALKTGLFFGASILMLHGQAIGTEAKDQYAVLHKFLGYPDGETPEGGVILDAQGNIYGTTASGGSEEFGTIYKIAPDNTETVIYSFTSISSGVNPNGSLAIDGKGNIYGVTYYGGANQTDCELGCGTVFKVTPNGAETVLYSFCSHTSCTDGLYPVGGVILDSQGNIYGTTLDGGNAGCQGINGNQGCGTVFKIAPDGAEKVLYSFCQRKKCRDGQNPAGTLIADQDGNLYGTTLIGGSGGGGTVFKVKQDGSEAVLHSFCCDNAAGYSPSSGLIRDKDGNFYGETTYGGDHAYNGGTLYKLTPNGRAFGILYSFCAELSCADGNMPSGGLAMDKSGNMVGTTTEGGKFADCNESYGCGTIFEFSANGEKVLHSFCAKQNCADGSLPLGVIMNKTGDLVGATEQGGVTTCASPTLCGVVFELKR